jgi:hypothetical protein
MNISKGIAAKENNMEILTVKDVAKELKASPAFVYKHYQKLGGFKVAGIIRFSKPQFENLVEKGNDNIPASREMDV